LDFYHNDANNDIVTCRTQKSFARKKVTDSQAGLSAEARIDVDHDKWSEFQKRGTEFKAYGRVKGIAPDDNYEGYYGFWLVARDDRKSFPDGAGDNPRGEVRLMMILKQSGSGKVTQSICHPRQSICTIVEPLHRLLVERTCTITMDMSTIMNTLRTPMLMIFHMRMPMNGIATYRVLMLVLLAYTCV
jgi:hypothetical protein